MLIFNYGSNHPAQLAERLEVSQDSLLKRSDPAVLRNHKRTFRGYSTTWDGGVASIEKKQGRNVFGYVSKLNKDELDQLSEYEGGKYFLKKFKVEVKGKSRPAQAFVQKNSAKRTQPTKDYLKAVCKTISSFWETDQKLTWEDFREE